jgi:hypothetical protein
MRNALAALLLSALATTAQARPVTFPDGTASRTEVDGSDVVTQVEYTLNRSLALGAYGLTEDDGDRRSVGVVANFLLMRRNTEDSQANIYVMAGAGPSWVREPDGSGRDSVASGYVAAEADWETRRLFAAAGTKVSIVDDDTEVGWRTRVGVAPYVANTGSLHTWIMLQAGRAAKPGAKIEVTPLIRLFKGPVLGEAGISHRGNFFGTLWFYF